MRSVEASGKTVEEAVAAALAELGVSEAQVETEVLEESHGFLGILGRTQVRVKVTVKEQAEASADARPPPPVAAPEEVEGPEAAPAAALEDEDDELGPIAQDVLQRLLALMGVEAQASLKSSSRERVVLELSGPDVALLIGRHGDTLDALQLATALGANRRSQQKKRVVVDAENYRERREQMLTNLAHANARKVRESSREAVLPDLKPYERRIIHLALVDEPGVRTYSEGEGRRRKLVISPADD
ncbi:MAG: RNA-binding cell elongation regulator Jag/EloR [Armatimonadota bacterium]